MPSQIDTGFGTNMDNLIGEQAATGLRQTSFGDFRARSIWSGDSGAFITSVHVTPRTGLTASGSGFPAAAMYDLIGLYCGNQIDAVQNFFVKAQRDVTVIADKVFLASPRSTLLSTDIAPSKGFYIPPNKWAHIFCLLPIDAGGLGVATYFNLTVWGELLTGPALPYTLR